MESLKIIEKKDKIILGTGTSVPLLVYRYTGYILI
jgi:hypothetical protein